MSDRDHYIELHRQLHTQSTLHFTGKSLRKYIEQIDSLIAEHNCGTILDYGCGKAQFWPAQWQGKIQGYDPAWEKFNKEPVPADLVICCDVMEHIPKSEIENTLTHINSLANRWTFFAIDTKQAKKRFLDGSNCHVTVHTPEWWREQLQKYCPRHTVQFEAVK